jgi:hypothetical protein
MFKKVLAIVSAVVTMVIMAIPAVAWFGCGCGFGCGFGLFGPFGVFGPFGIFGPFGFGSGFGCW